MRSALLSKHLDVDGYFSATVGQFFDFDAHGVVGQERLDEFGPLNETRCSRIEVVVSANVEGFFYVLDAIEVEVEHWSFQYCAVVFVDNGECGRIDHIVYSQNITECFDKGGFAGSHLAVEGEDIATFIAEIDRSHKFLCCGVDAIDGFYDKFHTAKLQ